MVTPSIEAHMIILKKNIDVKHNYNPPPVRMHSRGQVIGHDAMLQFATSLHGSERIAPHP